MKKMFLIALPMSMLVACSTAKPIVKASESTSEFDNAVYSGETTVFATDSTGATQYRVFSQGSTGFVSQASVRGNAESRATKFCADQGKRLKLLQERRSSPVQILGNFPRSELIFICID
jgi:putative hemolysin